MNIKRYDNDLEWGDGSCSCTPTMTEYDDGYYVTYAAHNPED